MRPESQMCTSEGVSDRQRVCVVCGASLGLTENLFMILGALTSKIVGQSHYSASARLVIQNPDPGRLKPRHAAGRRGWRSHSAHTAAKWLTIAHWPYFMVIRAYRQWNIRHRPEYGSLVKRTGIRRACRQPSSIFYGGTGSAGDNLVKRRKDESCTAGTPGPARLEPPVNPGVCQHPLHCWHLRQLPPPLCGNPPVSPACVTKSTR